MLLFSNSFTSLGDNANAKNAHTTYIGKNNVICVPVNCQKYVLIWRVNVFPRPHATDNPNEPKKNIRKVLFVNANLISVNISLIVILPSQDDNDVPYRKVAIEEIIINKPIIAAPV